MSSTRLFVTASLLFLTLISVGVIAEAERNYATVAERGDSTATVDGVVLDDGVELSVQVYNSMNQPLRVQYVTIDLSHNDGHGGSSTPYNGYRTVDPGAETLTVSVPERLVGGSLSAGDTVTVRGTVVVEVYNNYRFDILIDSTKVTL